MSRVFRSVCSCADTQHAQLNRHQRRLGIALGLGIQIQLHHRTGAGKHIATLQNQIVEIVTRLFANQYRHLLLQLRQLARQFVQLVLLSFAQIRQHHLQSKLGLFL